MVKQVNKFKPMKTLKKSILLVGLICISVNLFAQEDIVVKDTTGFVSGKDYILGEITISGLERFSEQTVKVHSGLIQGSNIKLPGDKLTSAIKKLYDTKQFSKVDVYLTKLEGNTAFIEIEVKELPQLNQMLFPQFSATKSKAMQEEVKINQGEMVTDNLLITTKNFFTDKFRKQGFLNAKVSVDTKASDKPNTVDVIVNVDKGEKIKIKHINFHGVDIVSEAKLKKEMKKTKEMKFYRFWKKSKYIEDEYREDLQKVIDAYSEKGLRDAIITDKKLTHNEDNTKSGVLGDYIRTTG